jgi:hypothetical protein
MYHLWPLTTQRSPLFSARVRIMPAGSEPEPGAGSVITMEERTSPRTIGRSQRCCCSGVPTFCRTIMLPSSGGAQLQAAGPKRERPSSS